MGTKPSSFLIRDLDTGASRVTYPGMISVLHHQARLVISIVRPPQCLRVEKAILLWRVGEAALHALTVAD